MTTMLRAATYVTYAIPMTENETLKRTKRELIFWAPKMLTILAAAAFFFLATPTGMDTIENPDDSESTSATSDPSLSDYRDEAERVCGGPVVETSPAVKSATVVVVKNDGTVAEMDKEDARALMRADVPVWPIAVCVA